MDYAILIILYILTISNCYEAAIHNEDETDMSKVLKLMEKRLVFLEERSKEFDDFRKAEEKRTSVFETAIAKNKQIIEDLKTRLNKALKRVAVLEHKQGPVSDTDIGTFPKYEEGRLVKNYSNKTKSPKVNSKSI